MKSVGVWTSRRLNKAPTKLGSLPASCSRVQSFTALTTNADSTLNQVGLAPHSVEDTTGNSNDGRDSPVYCPFPQPPTTTRSHA